MKVLRHKNLFGILFAVLLCLPMFSILGRTAYTIVNKNAYQSYSGITNNYATKEYYNTLTEDRTYYVDNSATSLTTSGWLYNKYFYDSAQFMQQSDYDLTNTNSFRLYIRNTGEKELVIYNNNSIVHDINISSSNLTLIFNYIYVQNLTGTYTLNQVPSLYTYNYSYNYSLDNAFTYSINQVIDNNNFGELDFFEWFTDMFLDSSNTTNAMYVHFINWYLNYALLISLAYILFLVLMWFINYIRRLLDKGMNIGNGSY